MLKGIQITYKNLFINTIQFLTKITYLKKDIFILKLKSNITKASSKNVDVIIFQLYQNVIHFLCNQRFKRKNVISKIKSNKETIQLLKTIV